MSEILKNMYARLLATACNLLPVLFEYVRSHDIRGKGMLFKYLKPEKEELTADCRGIFYRLNLKDDIQQQIYLNCYERENINFISRLLKPGDIFFDAGANVGAYTLRAAKQLKSGENVYAFEPEPDNFARLDFNCSLNEFSKNINRFPVALSNKSGKAVLYRSDSRHSGWHSLNKYSDILKDNVEVITETLDNFVSKNSIKSIDLIKIDVEANEFELLEGAKFCLLEKTVKRYFIEFNGGRLAEKNKTFGEFIKIFAEYGYTPQKINLGLAMKLINGDIKQEEVCENFLFEASS